MAKVELKNIAKTFDSGIKAADDISFSVNDDELLTLLGPSGCGKTTTLRLVAGLERPDSGEILIDGARVNDVPPSKRDVAFVFQSYALYPHMTVLDNIAVGLRIKKADKKDIKSRVFKTSKMLGISKLLGRRPRHLSGGQKQRVALARAVVRNPRLFLLDEPLSNLDASLREKTRTELKLLFSTLKATVIYVTHDQVEAMTVSRRIVVLKDGRIQQTGTPREIYDTPLNTFVATFVGSPRMNLLRGRIVDNELTFGGFRIPFHRPIRACLCGPRRQGTSPLQQGKTIKNDGVIVGIRPEDIMVTPSPNMDETGNRPACASTADRRIGLPVRNTPACPAGTADRHTGESEIGRKEVNTSKKAHILLIEPIGHHSILTLGMDDLEFKAIVPPNFEPAGTKVTMVIDPSKIHLFDPVSGYRL